MKIRKLLSAALALSLGLSLSMPAMAAGTADARLAKVTLAVKETLGVKDEYEEFYGEPDETELGTRWGLSWTAQDKSLSVTATEEGKVLSMSQWRNSPTVVRRDGLHFPDMTPTEAKALADAFLDRVLTEGERAVYSDTMSGSVGLNATQYSFGGTIYLNGIPSPISFRVRVSVADRAVTYFYRGDQSDYVGQVPPPDTVTTVDAARAKLAETLDLELIYVLDDGEKQAVLRYIPRSTHDYYVDAATGALIDLTELREKLSRSAGSGDQLAPSIKNEAAMDSADSLSPVELEGIAKLEGVLTKEELTGKVKAWAELKLDGFEAAACSYSVERTDPEAPKTDEPAAVTARLSLVRKTDSVVERRYVTVDARTGELLSMSGYRNLYSDEPAALTQAEAQAKSDAFLGKLWGDQWAKCEVYYSSNAEKEGDTFYFTYAQKVNGYFFPGNTISIGISAADGAVLHFSKSFDDHVTFDDAQGLISLDEAKTAWAGTYAVELSYITVPVALDLLGPEVNPLRSAGWSWYSALKPGYQWGSNEGYYGGVDAKTGLPLTAEAAEPQVIAYDDIGGHWAEKALLELAVYNVGWYGQARPEEALTQVEYLKLLSSADGYHFNTEQDADGLYAYAYSRGILTAEERDEDKVLTRSGMVKMLLDSLGYKAVANLPGIFRCDYADADAIPAGHMGYAALAQGLDLVVGDENGNYGAGQTALRAEAAVLLWRYLSR